MKKFKVDKAVALRAAGLAIMIAGWAISNVQERRNIEDAVNDALEERGITKN